ASVPTLKLFDFQYNKFGFSVSSATLLLLTQILVCCIDRLNPHQESGRLRRAVKYGADLENSWSVFICTVL
ncbi:MAG: hypothetical protein ACLQHK_08095, partial [Gallionellaceae bacterium]